MWIAEARKRTSKRWRNVNLTWEQMLAKLRTPFRTVETMQEYRQMPKEDRDTAKEAAGGFVGGYLTDGLRRTTNVRERWLVTLDADDAYQGQWEAVTSLWDFTMACYPTHSSTSSKPRLRWIIPTDRAMTPEEYPAVARRVAEWIGIDTMDASTYECARLMYYPTISCDAPYDYHEQAGTVLRVDDVLATYGEHGAWKDVSLYPTGENEKALRVRAQRQAGDPREKSGMVGLFCRCFDVYEAIDRFLPDVYLPTADPNRYTYAAGTTAGGAVVYQDGLFLYSNHATDPAGGQCLNAFDLVRVHLFRDRDGEVSAEDNVQVTKLPSYGAMCQFASELPEIKEQRAADLTDAASAFADLVTTLGAETAVGAESDLRDGDETITVDDETGEVLSAPPVDTSWTEKLSLHPKTGECFPTTENALLILTHDPALRGKIQYNLFSERRVRGAGVPWREADEPAGAWEDLDDCGLILYMEKRWKFTGERVLLRAAELSSHYFRFHPVRAYLRGLVWDGQPRVETLFIRHFGAQDTPIVRAMTRKWMCAAVARAMKPGCKFDNMLVLTGEQNLGKSSFARILSRGWYNDSRIDMASKEGYDSLQGSWIIEIAELASIRRQDVEIVKTFLSKGEDTFRPAYAKYRKTFPRQCVFLGTTNEQEFLRDRTGNRRFWTITVNKRADLKALESEVDQLWAEARTLWENGETLWLDTPELQDALVELQGENQVQDELDGMLTKYLDTLLPENWEELSPTMRRDFIQGNLPVDPSKCTLRRDRVCLTEIRVELLCQDQVRGGGFDTDSRRVANLMNTRKDWVKCSRKERLRQYGPQWVYYRSDPNNPPKIQNATRARRLLYSDLTDEQFEMLFREAYVKQETVPS